MTWEDYKERVFYVGNIRRWMYETITEALPQLWDEPLWAYYRDTPLAKDLNKLFHIVVNGLYKDKSIDIKPAGGMYDGVDLVFQSIVRLGYWN